MADSDTYIPVDYGEDLSLEELRAPGAQAQAREGSTAVIRTSDRIGFKRCRRSWGWASHLRQNLGARDASNPLWTGTGIHFALEDFHGYNVYGGAVHAFEAYCEAAKRIQGAPAALPELRELGRGMMEYYTEYWLKERNPLKTLWVDGVPQVEVRALLEVPFKPRDFYPDSPYDKVLYSVTIDRVVEDEDGQLWLVDYKTAKQFQVMHFSIDPQVGAYYWVGNHIYPGRKIAGFIYQQHRKDLAHPPKLTAAGRISTDSRQLTSHALYRQAIVSIYGSDANKWPTDNLRLLNEIAEQETPDSDRFVRRDRIYRNEYSFESEGAKILMELEDMLNPRLPLYPNPTRDCANMCSFLHACQSIDDGSDWKYELNLSHQPKEKEQDSWRQFLPQPDLLTSERQRQRAFHQLQNPQVVQK